MAKSKNRKKPKKTAIKASVPIEKSKTTENLETTERTEIPKRRKRKKKKIDIKRYLMIGFIGLAMFSFIFTSLPGGGFSVGNNNNSNSSSSSAANIPVTTPSAIPTFKEEGSLNFVKEDGTNIRTIKIEIADDEPQRIQGMMYRKTIPNDTGMLFLFPDIAPRSFWMKNTHVSLDIMFIDEDNKIINIHENTPTLTEQRFPSTAPAKYVLEVAGGYCNAYGIQAGDQINFEVQ